MAYVVGEVQLLLKDCVGSTLPDSRGNIRFILIVQNLPDDVVDPRKHYDEDFSFKDLFN